MEFIKIEQFKGLEDNIQKVFLNWWKPKRYDLYIDSADLSQVECLDYIKENDEGILYNSMRDNMSFLEDMIPLFTEVQLRKFIEDKFKCKLMIEYTVCENIVVKLAKENSTTGSFEFKQKYTFPKNKFNLIQAYWKVALEIAKEEV